MIKTYVISLKDQKERRVAIKKQLCAINLKFTFFDAVDGRSNNLLLDPSYSGLKRRLYFGKDLTSPEIGALLSNREILKKIISGTDEVALILEDDVILHKDFLFTLNNLLTSKAEWELVRFLGKSKMSEYRQRKICSLGKNYNLVRIGTSPGGSYAYIIKKTGAKKLLNAMKHIYFPPDIIMGWPWKTHMGVMTVLPGIATWDKSFDSSLDCPDRFKKNLLTGWQKFIYPTTRGYFKIQLLFLKPFFYYRSYFNDKKTYSDSINVNQ